LLHRPMHPYTKLLIDSVPGRGLKEEVDGGQVGQDARVTRAEKITGCRFNPRCEYAQQYCREKEPELLEVESGHFVACHFPLNKAELLVQSR